jgi:BirA family transcriptional regulator, biotin operon repressor / biotin---[acetyl-CoA-carboxylase] ligase
VLSPLGFTLLRCLSDGEIHSGEALAAVGGISRARVSQLLKEADAAGLRLERKPGRGYRLHDALPFLERGAILAALEARAGALTIEVADTLDSTSSELARRAGRGEDVHRHLLVAEWQTAGRGRRGRGWAAVLGGSLTFSLGWRFSRGAGDLSALPLAVGLALARALEATGFVGIELKWPNDLIHGEAKVGGILVELSGDALGPSLAIVGVGVNVRLPASLRRSIGRPVTDLTAIAGRALLDRNMLLARFVAAMVTVLEGYAEAGFAPLRAAWQRRHAHQAKPVQVVLPDGGKVRGVVVGVDAAGALVLDSGGRRLRFVSGEVSLRRP